MKWRNALIGSLTLIAVAGCASTAASSPTGSGATPAGGAGVTVNMTNSNEFQPAAITVARATTVSWVNTSVMPHTVTDDRAERQSRQTPRCPQARKRGTPAC